MSVPQIPAIPEGAAKDFRGKIVIIGAGVTGLFAANALKYLGVDDFVVLEADNRFGGRLKPAIDFHDEVPLELGAEWIHASTAQIVKDMLVFPAEKGLEPSEFIKYQPEWFFRSRKASIMGCLYQETKFKHSTWWHWLDEHVYRHVQDKVQLNTAVTEVVYGEADGQVKLVLSNGTEIRADKVICTVPLGVLKKEGLVKFHPPLPASMRQAIDAVPMPPGLRVLFEMKEKFYPDLTSDGRLCGLLCDPDDLTFVYDPLLGKELSGKQNMLAFVAVGPNSAGEIGMLGDEELAKAALATIDQLFDGQGSKNYIKHIVQNWTQEPYILGAYTFGCASSLRTELGKTLNGKLLFAGEHTSLKYHSLVPGAALEGRRAAVEAVSS